MISSGFVYLENCFFPPLCPLASCQVRSVPVWYWTGRMDGCLDYVCLQLPFFFFPRYPFVFSWFDCMTVVPCGFLYHMVTSYQVISVWTLYYWLKPSESIWEKSRTFSLTRTHKAQGWPWESHSGWQTSRRDLHEKWMAVLFYSSCHGIVILGALSESTGSGKSLMLFLTVTLFLRGKYIRGRMMFNIDPMYAVPPVWPLSVTRYDSIM